MRGASRRILTLCLFLSAVVLFPRVSVNERITATRFCVLRCFVLCAIFVFLVLVVVSMTFIVLVFYVFGVIIYVFVCVSLALTCCFCAFF